MMCPVFNYSLFDGQHLPDLVISGPVTPTAIAY